MENVLITSANMGGDSSNVVVEQTIPSKFIFWNDTNTLVRTNSMHPRLHAKVPKMMSWYLYPNCDYYMWIDNRFNIMNSDVVESYISELGDADALFYRHTEFSRGRTSIQSEFDFIDNILKNENDHRHEYLNSRYGGQEYENMKNQIQTYLNDKDFKDEVMIEAGCFVYSKRLIEKQHNIMIEWMLHNMMYSINDQLSLPYLLFKHKVKYKLIENTTVWTDPRINGG